MSGRMSPLLALLNEAHIPDAGEPRRARGTVAQVDVLAEVRRAAEVRRSRDERHEAAVVAHPAGERAVVALLAGVVPAHEEGRRFEN